MSNTAVKIRRALISVSDKTGLVDLARALMDHSITLVSTGGSREVLAAAGLPVTEVSAVTGMAEFLDGRVKTLHPAIHAGLLARRDRPDHLAALSERGIDQIDLVVCNLYPFAQAVEGGGDRDQCIENIDIGGVALIRAAAKNHDAVTVVTDPEDYGRLIAALAKGEGSVGAALRRELAHKAYALTAAYDATIAAWLARDSELALPAQFAVAGRLGQRLRYGENPHQSAAFYRNDERRPGVATARQLQGRELSYNNYSDADAAFELVAEFGRPAVAIVKHANPCGVALGASLSEAWAKALASDPVSAYGGVVALNRPLDGATADAIARLFIEVVIAPEVEPEAAARLGSRGGLRLLAAGAVPDPCAASLTFRSVAGGFLVQERDRAAVDRSAWRVVSRRAPSAAEIEDLEFAERVVKHVKSNAIVLAKEGATVGIGAGQMSRVDSVRLAAQKAAEVAAAAGLEVPRSRGAALASDAFFPFADGIEAAAEAGVTAVVQPGGSLRDPEVIAAADRAGMAMVFTGLRRFRH
jgi:phosphoribosylaminoimidazolecarboxamide formyltransferase/IMP cyclohydrolase